MYTSNIRLVFNITAMSDISQLLVMQSNRMKRRPPSLVCCFQDVSINMYNLILVFAVWERAYTGRGLGLRPVSTLWEIIQWSWVRTIAWSNWFRELMIHEVISTRFINFSITTWHCFNSLPNDKFWTRPNSKESAISILMNMTKSFQKGYKTLWEKEKLLVTSNFSFSHSVFKRHILYTRKNQDLFGKGLRQAMTTYRTKYVFGPCLAASVKWNTFFQGWFLCVCVWGGQVLNFQLTI